MSGQPQAQPLPPLENLIKANQIHNIAAIPAEEKDKYYQGVKNLWDKINTHSPEHPEYQNAYKRLAELSVRVKGMINKYKQAQSHPAPSQSGKKPLLGGSESSVIVSDCVADQAVGNNQFSDRIMEVVRKIQMIPPPHYWTRPHEEGQAWIRDAKVKYAQALQKVEQAKILSAELNRSIRERQQAMKPFTPEEQHSINQRRAQYGHVMANTDEYINSVRTTQEQWKREQQRDQQQREQQEQLATNETASRSQAPNEFANFSGDNNQEGAGAHLNMPHVPTDPQPSALEGNQSMRAQFNQAVRSSINPVATAQQVQGQSQVSTSQVTAAQINTTQAPSTPAGTSGTLGSHLSSGMNTANSQQQEHSSHGPVNLPSTSQQGPPHPLSHKAAMAQVARSYSQPNIPQATPQSHSHPQVDNRNQQNKWPIPKQLQVSELRPVQMGPARPSLSGGPSTGAPGPMGQPGIQKVPGFVLEGEGERVLSKKKLAELVTQVTGAVGTDTVPLLDPDVEEVSKAIIALLDEAATYFPPPSPFYVDCHFKLLSSRLIAIHTLRHSTPSSPIV